MFDIVINEILFDPEYGTHPVRHLEPTVGIIDGDPNVFPPLSWKEVYESEVGRDHALAKPSGLKRLKRDIARRIPDLQMGLICGLRISTDARSGNETEDGKEKTKTGMEEQDRLKDVFKQIREKIRVEGKSSD